MKKAAWIEDDIKVVAEVYWDTLMLAIAIDEIMVNFDGWVSVMLVCYRAKLKLGYHGNTNIFFL